MSRPRVMFYVQHLMGIGHQRRAAAIARRLISRGADVQYVSGGFRVPGLDTASARVVQLPPARAADLSYAQLVDARGVSVSPEWQSARRDALLQVFRGFKPQALVIETFPFGRGLMRFELVPLIEAAKSAPFAPRIICSVRDIIEPKSDARTAAIAAQVEADFHRVLVHSDPDIIRFEESFPLAGRIGEQLRYTGFVAEQSAPTARADPGKGIVVSAGGGIVADALLTNAMRARRHSRLRFEEWLILAGPSIGDEMFIRLRKWAPAGVVVERNREDFASLLGHCRVSISQAGYNTLIDVVQARTRAVVVPFTDGRHIEQPTRARLFELRGLVRVVDAKGLNPETLAAAVDLAAESEPAGSAVLDVNGAERSAELVLAEIGH